MPIKRFPPGLIVTIAVALGSCSTPTEAPKEESKPAAAAVASPTPAVPETKIVRKDPRFDKLVPTDAKVEKLAEGHRWTEGPVWNRKENYLLFSYRLKNSG